MKMPLFKLSAARPGRDPGEERHCMSGSFKASLLICAAVAFTGAAPASAAEGAQDKPLRMHRAPHAPQPSTLPPPHLIGNPATRLSRHYGGTPIDVLTYHYDLNRTGWNQTETDLTPATVASSSFGLLATLNVDGNVLAQPLLLSGYVLPDGSTHDILFVVTGHDTVYAFDAQTYAVLWKRSMGTSQSSTDVGCGDVVPEYGISSTPVIVRTASNAATLYMVVATEPAAGKFVTRLWALNAGTGAYTVYPSLIAPSAKLSDGSILHFDPQNQWNRAGLAYNPANNSIYIGIGSHCDNNPNGITGWLLRYNASTLGLERAFHTVRSPGGLELASIWMSGFAPAIDTNGNVYVVTGNGDFTNKALDWGESVLQLPYTLDTVQSYFTPGSYSALNDEDADFGSGGVMLLPPAAGQTAPPMAVAMGKVGTLYLLNQTKLGGETSTDSGALQAISVTGSGLRGGPAFYNGPSGPTVFYQTGGDVLRAWSVNTGTAPSLTNTVSGANSNAGYGGSLPIVSSNGATPGTGVVWLINRAQEPFSIEAYDAVNLGNPIFSAQIGIWSNASNGNPFLTPIEANGRVYAPGYKVVQVFGLTP
jgi:hypothetical protein